MSRLLWFIPAVLLLLAVLLLELGDDSVRVETVATTSTTSTVPSTTTSVATTTTHYHPPTTRPTSMPRSHETAPIVRAAAPRGVVQDIIRNGFARFGAHVAEQAVRVAGCETGQTFNPAARNGHHAGLFQIAEPYHRARIARLGFTWEQMFQAEPNVAVAADLYGEQGWRPWTCRWAA